MAKTPRVPLTRKRKLWAEQRGGAAFWGQPLLPPDRAEARYRAALERAIRQMREEVEREVARTWDAHAPAVRSGMDASLASQSRILTNALARKFQAFFDRLAPGVAGKFVTQVDRHSTASLHSSLKEASGGLSLKTSVVTGRVAEIAKAATAENVGLIRSIPQQYFKDIQGAVMRSIQKGDGVKTVLEAVQKTGAVAERRAKLIARDQTAKATSAINAARLDALKVRKFEWLHSGGGKEPRPLHKDVLNGQIFRLDDPPVIDDKTGERGLPGQLINCRCRMVPVIDFGDDGE